MIDNTLPFASSGSNPASQSRLEEDYREDYDAWQAKPSPGTRASLLRKVQPVVDQAVTSYGRRGSPATKSKARYLAIQAFDTYDPYKGTLKTHLLSQLRSLQRAAAQQEMIISMPEQVSLDRNHVIQAENRLRDQLGRDPSDGEIADTTGLSLKRLAYVRQGRGAINTGSLLDDEGGMYSPASQIPGQNAAQSAWQRFIYNDLGPTDQAIMDYTLGLNGAPQLQSQEIARRLGITAGAVSQRAARIQAQLDQEHELSPFGG